MVKHKGKARDSTNQATGIGQTGGKIILFFILKKYQKTLAFYRVTLYNISVVRKGQEKSPKTLAQL